jgi:hypothetical protein
MKGDEPIGLQYMKISQGNPLCSFHYLKQAKMSFFFLSSFSFFFYKIREQEGGTGPRWVGEEVWNEWEGGGGGERG